jgi:23S rRNA (pseudouridine1915-N3)-methyltransferase
MRFRFIWIGKTRDAHIRALVDEYLKRLSRFVKFEVTELREESASRESSREEGVRILGALRDNALTILLDVAGREWSSQELAREIERWQQQSHKEIAFVIGGQDGVSDEVVKRANVRWSLSRLTLTHEMARVVLAEQLYRAYTIIHGLPYQK